MRHAGLKATKGLAAQSAWITAGPIAKLVSKHSERAYPLRLLRLSLRRETLGRSTACPCATAYLPLVQCPYIMPEDFKTEVDMDGWRH